MDYIFGQDSLKTVGDSHTDLQGFCSIMREYPDQNITDNFTVIEKVKSDEDSEGKCYDWYTLKDHYRYVDRVKTVTSYTETKTAYIEDTEVVFENVADGELTVYVKDSEGNYPNHTVERMGDIVKVSFEPLEYITTVTISIL